MNSREEFCLLNRSSRYDRDSAKSQLVRIDPTGMKALKSCFKNWRPNLSFVLTVLLGRDKWPLELSSTSNFQVVTKGVRVASLRKIGCEKTLGSDQRCR